MASALRLREVSERCSQAVSCLDPDGIVINSGHFRIDLDSRRVWVRGEEIHLEEDEFEMLVFLLRHRTSIITPHTQLTTRWNRDRIRHSDFLRVLTKLQRKLEHATGNGYIRTEPWLICRFEPGR